MRNCLFVLFVSSVLVGCGGNSNPKGSLKRGVADVKKLPAASEQVSSDSMNWLSWRGPNRNGIAVNQTPLVKWDESQDLIWKAKVPGRGHSSPTIVSDRIFLTTASKADQTQSLLCYDRKTGDQLWSKTVHEGNLTKRIHFSNSHASASVASDGVNVFCLFINQKRVMLTKFDLEGEQLWQKELGTYKSDFNFGSGASPIFWDSKLIVTSECGADSFIVALSPDDGSQIWRIDRTNSNSFSTPVVANVAGKFQLLMSGLNTVKGYDPNSGDELWSVPTPWSVSCGTVVWYDDMAIASGGFPESQTLSVKADGTAKVVWSNNVKCYEQSMIVVDDHVYGLSDSGFCYCWDAKTGKEKWKARMKSKVSASPVFANEHLYFVTEDGSCFVIKANPDEYELVAENRLGESAFATPTFVDDKIYARVGIGQQQTQRQEWLYCFGSSSE